MKDMENRSLDSKQSGIRTYFHSLFDVKADMMCYDELQEMMEGNTVISGSNMWILIMAKTIQDLQTQLDAKQAQFDSMETLLARQINCREISKKAEQIFSKLLDCSCGVISSESGDYVLLCASVEEPLLPDEERTIENWLLTETNLSRAELRITALDSEEAVDTTDGT